MLYLLKVEGSTYTIIEEAAEAHATRPGFLWVAEQAVPVAARQRFAVYDGATWKTNADRVDGGEDHGPAPTWEAGVAAGALAHANAPKAQKKARPVAPDGVTVDELRDVFPQLDLDKVNAGHVTACLARRSDPSKARKP